MKVPAWNLLVVLCALALPAKVWARTTCDPRSDHAYQFSSPRVVTHELALETGANGSASFLWPGSSMADSALLFVSLSAAPGAPVEVTVAAPGIAIAQSLGSGSTGRRALNVSDLRGVPAGTRVTLSSPQASLVGPLATLASFHNQLPLHEAVLVLAPHPDDAEIAAFGLYADRHSTVLTVTAGNAGAPIYCDVAPEPEAHYRLKGELRVIDSVTVPWQGGVPVGRAFNLGYFDGCLRAMHNAIDTPVNELFVTNDDVLPYRRLNQGRLLPVESRKATWRHLVMDLKSVLSRTRPAIVVTPDPRTDDHPDHQLTTVALAEALAQTRQSPHILLYTNHADGDRYPYGAPGEALPPPPWCGPAPLTAASFYAHPLSVGLQRRKLMALESMHDLRLPPSAQHDFAATVDPRCTRPATRLPGDNFLVRGVRAHEVFLVLDRAGLLTLVSQRPF
ncbi:MAG: PIG-L family deacetylase [Myxococcales bacterium]|nr:PIG-L family deacetylase [Myxococcales bacterium]